jgi:para-aminobenzoate synthetase component 1
VKATTATFTISSNDIYKAKMLNWANQFNIFCLLDNNQYNSGPSAFECLLAAGCKRSFTPHNNDTFGALQQFHQQQPSWLFGHFGYALNNETESIFITKPNLIDFGKAFFFEPEILIRLTENELSIESDSHDSATIFADLEACSPISADHGFSGLNAIPLMSKDAYIKAVTALKQHIQRGDCYELNFCQYFLAEHTTVPPAYLFQQLSKLSPNPFNALYKLNDQFCICASPERYLKKTGQTLLSQPIKGTISRNLQSSVEDEANKYFLRNSQKEKSENVMVVDLVRNDLSRVCEEGSVFVEELFGIYSFPQVHQMISSVKGTLRSDLYFTDAIKATFPMGSMTGAPKKRVMELIDVYETHARGLFSGAIGYITPQADFDFNVVIRSIFYDQAEQLVSFSAGGGITFYSDPEKEYEESLLKVQAIIKVLSGVGE